MLGRKRVLCFAVVSRFFFCLWIVKSCSGGLPTLAGDAHVHREVLAARPSGAALLRRKLGLAGPRRLPVASSDEIFFFFCLFLFHFVEIFTAMGEERGRGRGPPRERSKPRTHSPGRSRPKICSPDSQAHRTGNCPYMATPVGWGPCRELCFIRSRPKGGGHWVHLRRAEGAGLLGRLGRRAEGRSFRENSTFKPPATNAHSSGPGAFSWVRGPSLQGAGNCSAAEPVHLSFCSRCSPAFLAAERGAADRFHPAGSLAQGHQSPHSPSSR